MNQTEAATANGTKTLPDGWRWVRLSDVCELVGDSINPQDYPQDIFAHYSIPAFDNGRAPELQSGKSILSNKILFPSGAVLFSKLNPRISRVWHVTDLHPHQRICSTEFLPLLPRELKCLTPDIWCLSCRSHV